MYGQSVPQPYAAPAPPPYAAPAPTFPQSLHDVPANARMNETFGVGFGAVSIGALILMVDYFVQLVGESFSDMNDLKWFGGTLVVGLGAGAIEIMRRVRATTMVPRGGEVALYRSGKLNGVIGTGQIGEFRLRITNTIRELFAFGMLGLFGTIGAMAEATGASASLSLIAWTFAVAISCVGGFASAIWVRTLAKHYIVPRGNGTEHVVVLRSTLRRFGWLR